MNELEEIRKKKLQQIKEQNKELQEQQQLNQQISIMEEVVYRYLTPDAISRYGNVKIAHPEKAIRVLTLLFQAIKQGSIQEKINDSQLKELLIRFNNEPKFKIKRK